MKTYFYYILLFLGFTTLTSCSSEELKLIPVKNGKSYQYIDRDGKIVINPQFMQAYPFYDGIALVQDASEKWGYIDESGKYTIPATYKYATEFRHESIAWAVTENGAPTIINRKGEIIKILKDAVEVMSFSDGLAAFRTSLRDVEIIDTVATVSPVTDNNPNHIKSNGHLWGFVNQEGVVLINQQFQDVKLFREGKCAVRNENGKWGFIDKEGKLIINYQFDETDDIGFSDGLATVKLGEKWGLINEEGKYVINPQYENLQVDSKGFYKFEQNRKWGWCDKEGKVIINPQFDGVLAFGDNVIAPFEVSKDRYNSSWGYVDKEGKIVINPQFDFATPFINNLALIRAADKVGFVDKEGKYIINPQFDVTQEDSYYRLVNFFIASKRNVGSLDKIKTDYFAMESIIEKINVGSPEGFKINDRIGTVLQKLKFPQDKIPQYTYEHRVLTNQLMSADASYNFYILGNYYKQTPSEWYIKDEFDADAKVQGYMYEINLTGKAIGKEKEIMSAIEKSIKGYTKLTENTDKSRVTLSNKDQVVRIVRNGSIVFITVATLDLDAHMFEGEYNEESVGVDTTALVVPDK